MEVDFSAFHFMRPLWLLLLLPGLALPLIWGRRQNPLTRLRDMIAPHLLAHLLINPEQQRRVRPVHLLSALLIGSALAAAGPTWQQDRPAFLDDKAPLILAVDLSPSMEATDVPPSRLVAVQHKLQDLAARRKGARTALIAYAGSAHLVLPATDDPTLLDTFLQALSSDLITRPGKDALGVVELAKQLLSAERSVGTLVLITDGADTQQLPQITQALRGGALQVLVLAVGSADGGILVDAQGQPRVGADGRPLLADFDQKALQQLADAADAPLGSLTLNGDDLDWIELHAQRHFQAAQGDDQQIHWKDAGYWLCWPLALLTLISLRRGWQVSWLAAVCLAFGLGGVAPPAKAGVLADAFFTADQQGRWAFENQHYPQAAEHFNDPYWKGLAAYQAADYSAALASFARLNSAEAYFYMGNIYVRLSQFQAAIGAYEQAIVRQPEFPAATANLALARALQKDHDDQQKAGLTAEGADKVLYDKQKPGGQATQLTVNKSSSDEQWLQNLTTSPARFLRQKFLIQDARRQSAEGQQP